jgi:serpin B
VQLLKNLGVATAFDPTMADFAGIDGKTDLFVQDAIHKATITVDEEGAEAAAATGISVGGASGETDQPMLIADHSFALAIYDNVTGSILFLGRVQDPTQSM